MRAFRTSTRALLKSIAVFRHADLRHARLRYPSFALAPLLHAIPFASLSRSRHEHGLNDGNYGSCIEAMRDLHEGSFSRNSPIRVAYDSDFSQREP
jgi:hypothetical protein